MGEVRDMFEWEMDDADLESVRQKSEINKVERATGVIAAAKYLADKGINPTAYLAGEDASHDGGLYFLRVSWKSLAYLILAACVGTLILIGTGVFGV